MKAIIHLKKRLALPQTSWQLCLLAAIGGFASALLVVLFIFANLCEGDCGGHGGGRGGGCGDGDSSHSGGSSVESADKRC